ncbi:hypothetical protein ACJMK2_007123 [Sinanodonta woodiana]|uniref:TELO2-interacting protein 1 homolog n=1 Tax=Sinanodonta woodiana TaxID=1069815 RepID=A0ABD3VHG8_SINWO
MAILRYSKKGSQDLYLDVYTCMEFVLGNTQLNRWQLFLDIFNVACIMLSIPGDQTRVANLSEELKLAIIQTIRTLVKKSDYTGLLRNLYIVACLPILGHAVSLLLNIAELEKARNLRILALECLLDISLADSQYSSCIKADIGTRFASFLPGISITLCKIITGDIKQGYTVTMKALYVWMRIVSLVMDDKLLDIARQKMAGQQEPVDEKLKGLIVERNSRWLSDTGSKLSVLVKQVGSVRGHSNWRVRYGLVECAEHLLLHCTRSLKESVPQFLEILVSLIGDQYTNVAAESRRALELFNQSQTGEQERHLVEILEENLHKLTTSLPRQIRTAEEEQKLSILKLLAGYLTLLGSKVKSLLLSQPHLKRLSLALVQTLEIDCSDIKIVEERTVITGHGASAVDPRNNTVVVRPRKHFKHFHDERIFQKLQTICRLLGYYGEINLLVDQFLDIFHESKVYKMPATLIINEIMLGTTGKYGKMLIEEYLSPSNFDLVTHHSPELNMYQGLEKRLNELRITRLHAITSNTDSISSYSSNTIQLCLYLEGIGNFSQVLGKDFEPILIQVLYPLLEKLGDESSYISSTAYLALLDVTKACCLRSLDKLIEHNVDYLMNSISLKLRGFNSDKKSPSVLKVMLQYCTSDVLPLVEDTVMEILSVLDDYHAESAALFMGVLNELAKAVYRWFPPTKKQKKEPVKRAMESSHPNNSTLVPQTDDEQRDTVPAEEIAKFFMEHHRQKRQAEGEISEEDLQNFEPQLNQEPDPEEDGISDVAKESELPKHVKAVKEVMLRSKHLLSSKHPRLRLLVLDTIGHCCRSLQDYKNTLLPLIHEVWSPFALRFSDEEKLVTIQALQILLVMAEVSEDFIRQKTVKDVLPKLFSFLDKQAKISVHTGKAYQFTVNYKLQLATLSKLGRICSMLSLEGNEIDLVASACLPYLSVRQPKTLQEASMDSCRELIRLDQDLMWLRLNTVYSPVQYIPPDDNFQQIKVPP